MENSYRYFENRACKYYPCHEGIEEMNCLFCFCPLYGREHCPGNPEYITNREGEKIKSCLHCTFPHQPEHYDKLMQLLRKKNAKKDGVFVETAAGKNLTDAFVRAAVHRYHYDWKDEKKMRKVAAKVREALEGQEGFFYILPEPESSFFGYLPKEGTLYAGVILTLGEKIDRLQSSYSDSGDLESAYMVEVISCELLQNAYLQCGEYLGKHTCYVPEEFYFFGERKELPLEKMPSLLAYQSKKRVTCNSSFCLEPKKSVLFLVKLKEAGENQDRLKSGGISLKMCEACGKKDCIYRKN